MFKEFGVEIRFLNNDAARLVTCSLLSAVIPWKYISHFMTIISCPLNIGLGMNAFLLLGSLLVFLNAVEGNTEIVNFQATEGLGVDLEFTNAW